MKLFQLHATQFLPIAKDEAWAFLSNPKNLQCITPAQMGFRILSGAEKDMYPGQIIQYKVSPFPGFTTSWVSEITHVEHESYFVDEQRFGPYSLWHHKHFLHPADGGVIMEDIVDYKLPLGFLGRWMHTLFVKKQLHDIFRYRSRKLRELFGNPIGHSEKLTFSSV